MANEFLITRIKSKCRTFDVTSQQRYDEYKTDEVESVKTRRPVGGFVERFPGVTSLKLHLESSGAFDMEYFEQAFNAGKKVKITIIE